jgi:polysaccharide export outer membrane protein
LFAAILFATTACTSCQQLMTHPNPRFLPPPDTTLSTSFPKELHKAVLPEYRIEPPDVLIVNAIHVVPRSPYYLRTLDEVSISAFLPAVDAPPMEGDYVVKPGGVVDLGGEFGSVKIAGMNVEEAQEALEKHISQYVNDPVVSISLTSIGTGEQIAGEHLVGPDGRITLGTYGSVKVVGLTKAEAKEAVERHLSQTLEDPMVSVDVFGYNSKVYYVITQGAGLGDTVVSFPVTGNETVLDAIAQIAGLSEQSSKRIWIARPGQSSEGCDQVLPVDWSAITMRGDVTTNFQVLPGDRVYIAEDRFVAFDTMLAKFITPFERIFGFTILGTETVTRLSGNVLQGGGNPIGNRF